MAHVSLHSPRLGYRVLDQPDLDAFHELITDDHVKRYLCDRGGPGLPFAARASTPASPRLRGRGRAQRVGARAGETRVRALPPAPRRFRTDDLGSLSASHGLSGSGRWRPCPSGGTGPSYVQAPTCAQIANIRSFEDLNAADKQLVMAVLGYDLGALQD